MNIKVSNGFSKALLPCREFIHKLFIAKTLVPESQIICRRFESGPSSRSKELSTEEGQGTNRRAYHDNSVIFWHNFIFNVY